ncbi:MAG TPA: 2OG-Fe dioxygenase family protein [Rhodocyclaceae bacterium]|nr:2OG-Fe dioxygenase family protein [Rhodocyclaceae bacterium]HNI00602.1 2OG-Fe dioxygenase family protein [Rhodocyclaceae bacterium]
MTPPDTPASASTPADTAQVTLARLAQADFCFLPATATRAWLTMIAPAWAADWGPFAASWNALELDTWMADGGRYRRRRYATLSATPGSDALSREPHQPHYQSLDYNPLNGGVARHFAPIDEAVLRGATMQAALALGLRCYAHLQPAQAAHVEVHQFRIEANPDSAGLPTPEGAHRDGVDFVLVMMVARHNIASGTTEIFDLDGRPRDRFTLTAPCDAALVHDRRALHGVTPITPLDPGQPAWRDVLVATYRRPAA